MSLKCNQYILLSLTLDIQNRELFIETKQIELTNLEFRLLHTFTKNAHQALDRDFLRDEVWGDDSVNFHNKTINVAMNRLKKCARNVLMVY